MVTSLELRRLASQIAKARSTRSQSAFFAYFAINYCGMNSQPKMIGHSWVANRYVSHWPLVRIGRIHIETHWPLDRFFKPRPLPRIVSSEVLNAFIQKCKDNLQQFYDKKDMSSKRRLFFAWKKQSSLVIVERRKLDAWRNRHWQGFIEKLRVSALKSHFSAWRSIVTFSKIKQRIMYRKYRIAFMQ